MSILIVLIPSAILGALIERPRRPRVYRKKLNHI